MVEIFSLLIAVVGLPIAFYQLPIEKRRKVISWVRLGRRRKFEAVAYLEESLAGGHSSVSTVADLFELTQLWEIDRSNYGEFNIAKDELASWWRAFPDGLVACRDDEGNIIGGLGIWPVGPDWLAQLSELCNPEQIISHATIKAALGRRKLSHWYISGIVLQDHEHNFLGKRLLPRLIQNAVLTVSLTRGFDPRSTIYAMPISESGSRLLRRFGFREHVPTTCDPPLYYRQSEPTFLKAVVGLNLKEA